MSSSELNAVHFGLHAASSTGFLSISAGRMYQFQPHCIQPTESDVEWSRRRLATQRQQVDAEKRERTCGCLARSGETEWQKRPGVEKSSRRAMRPRKSKGINISRPTRLRR